MRKTWSADWNRNEEYVKARRLADSPDEKTANAPLNENDTEKKHETTIWHVIV